MLERVLHALGIIVLWLWSSAVFAQDCGINGGLYTDDGCACYSNYYPLNTTDCDGVGECSQINPVSPLITEHVGSLDIAEFVNGNLHLKISSPVRENRHVESLSLNGNCSYPGVAWEKTVEGCDDVFQFTGLASYIFSGCLFFIEKVQDIYLYQTSVSMKVVDDIGEIRGISLTRETVSSVTIEIVIPFLVSAYITNLSVEPGFVLSAALISQSLNFGSETLEITIRTVINAPYTVVIGFINGVPAGSTSCIGSGDCVQDWETIVVLPNGQCDFAGSYSMVFLGGCRDGYSCNENVATNATLTLNIKEGNLCAGSVSIVADSSGTLQSYEDDTFTETKSVFDTGTIAYFAPEVVSDIPIASLQLDEVKIVYNGDSILLFSDGVLTQEGSQNEFSTYPNGGFGFRLNVDEAGSGALFEIPSSQIVFEFDVEIVVFIEHTGQFRRRSVTESKPMHFTRHVVGILRDSSNTNAAKLENHISYQNSGTSILHTTTASGSPPLFCMIVATLLIQ